MLQTLIEFDRRKSYDSIIWYQSIDLGMAEKRTDGRLDAMDSTLEDIRAELQRLSNFEKKVEKLPDLERNMELLAPSVAQLIKLTEERD